MSLPEAHALLAAFGTPDAALLIKNFCASGPQCICDLFSALVDPRPATEPRDGRAVFEDEHACMFALATAHPDAFLAQIHAHPAIAGRGSVITGLAVVPGTGADALLLAGLRHRRGHHRWAALRALLGRRCDALAPRLPALLRDRDPSVGFAALDGLRRWGTTGDLPALLRYIDTAPAGGVEFGLDAIEAICARADHPLPAGHPGPRLAVLTARGAAIALHVTVASRVAAGEPLADIDGQPLRAPYPGVVSALDQHPDRLAITIRRT